MKLIRKGGFIMFDNMLWAGRVAIEDKRLNDSETKAVFATSQLAINDERCDTHTLSLADGFMVVHKK